MTTTDTLTSNAIALIKTQLEQLKEQYEAGNLTEQTYDSSRSVLEICGRERPMRAASSSWVQPKSVSSWS